MLYINAQGYQDSAAWRWLSYTLSSNIFLIVPDIVQPLIMIAIIVVAKPIQPMQMTM